MQWSHSRIGTFERCKANFKMHYIDQIETFPTMDPSSDLAIGNLMHTALEKGLDEATREYFAKYNIISDGHIEEVMKVEHMLPMVVPHIPDDAIHEFKIECDEFIGFVDLITFNDDGTINVIDFKYSNSVEYYLTDRQLHIYKYYIEKLTKWKVGSLQYWFIPKVKIRKKFDEDLFEFRRRLQGELDKIHGIIIEEVEFNQEKVDEFFKLVQEAQGMLDDPHANWKKEPNTLCGWCRFEKYCIQGKEDEIMGLLPENKRRNIEKVERKVIWIYGSPFSGKTVFANGFPDPLMLNTDGNIEFVDAPYIPIKDRVVKTGRLTERTFAWEVFKEVISELEEKDNTFKTIVVDLLEDTREHARLYMYDKLGITHESDDSFRAWDKVRTEYESTMKRLTNLPYENIVLISHEDISKDITKKSGDKVTAVKPNIQEKTANKIAGMVDIVARVVANGDTRTLEFKQDEVVFGGGRLPIGSVDPIPLEYDALCEVYDMAKKNLNIKNNPTKKVENHVEQDDVVDDHVELGDDHVGEPNMDQNIEEVEEVVETPTRRSRKSRKSRS